VPEPRGHRARALTARVEARGRDGGDVVAEARDAQTTVEVEAWEHDGGGGGGTNTR
jgi:hypothetical protein